MAQKMFITLDLQFILHILSNIESLLNTELIYMYYYHANLFNKLVLLFKS